MWSMNRRLGETEYHARVYFDPNSISMANVDGHIFFSARGMSGEVIRLFLYRWNNNYHLIVSTLDDGGVWRQAALYPISDQPHVIEIEWQAASSGLLNLWVDGVLARTISAISNSTKTIESVFLGPSSGLDAGTVGTYFLDAFESRRQSYIGPEGVSADFTAEPTGGFAPLMVQFTSSVLTSEPTVTYAWDFGDGGTSDRGESATHLH
jgi:hypothetical protein